MIKKFKWQNVVVVKSWEHAIQHLNHPHWKENIGEIFVVGGKSLFE